jgi:hypothetical protein
MRSLTNVFKKHCRPEGCRTAYMDLGWDLGGEGGVSEQGGGGVGVKMLACFLARIWAVR